MANAVSFHGGTNPNIFMCTLSAAGAFVIYNGEKDYIIRRIGFAYYSPIASNLYGWRLYLSPGWYLCWQYLSAVNPLIAVNAGSVEVNPNVYVMKGNQLMIHFTDFAPGVDQVILYGAIEVVSKEREKAFVEVIG